PAIQAPWPPPGPRRTDPLVRDSRSRRQLPRQHTGYGTRRAQLTPTMMLFRSLAVAAALAYTTAAGASGLDQLHAFLTETKTSKGTFTQSVASKTRPAAQMSSGTFAFKRTGTCRWTYA